MMSETPSLAGGAEDKASTPSAQCRPFAVSNDPLSVWQVVSTTLLLVAAWWVGGKVLPWQAWPLVSLLVSGLIVRVFVLQHDCGHQSLFSKRSLNEGFGRSLACITGIAFHTWRTEHNWHHVHQAKLSSRGVDGMNSPMTVLEARENPDQARTRARVISPLGVSFMGMASLIFLRKRPQEFFQFRPKFRWPVPDRDKLIKSIRWTNAGHLIVNAAVAFWLGPVAWLCLYALPMVLGGMIGSYLFWVQHNFEHTYHADDDHWSFVEAGLEGSSYLKLPWPLSWFTASIGLHHVHHLDPRIPNYRLEAARRAVPALAAVKPLTRTDLVHSFDHVFWDEAQGRMVTLPQALGTES